MQQRKLAAEAKKTKKTLEAHEDTSSDEDEASEVQMDPPASSGGAADACSIKACCSSF